MSIGRRIRLEQTLNSMGALIVVLALSVAVAHGAEEKNPLKNTDVFYTDPASIYGDTARYEVFRNNKKVGDHSISFRKNNNKLQVDVSSNLVVRYLGVPVYRYAYVATEQWLDNKFQSVASRIKDNLKKEHVITASIEGRVLKITNRGVQKASPAVKFPTNHWHPGVVSETKVFHTLHGRMYYVKITSLGPERIYLKDISTPDNDKTVMVEAKRYSYSGGFEADVWYDSELRWVRLVFKADDGSTIDYRCVTCLSDDSKR